MWVLPGIITAFYSTIGGLKAVIVPWNFPLTNAANKLAPILACRNTVVLKPSEVVLKPSEVSPLSPLMLAELTHDIGFPPRVINVVHGTGAEIGTVLVRHPGIDKITFTGRHQTGIQMLESGCPLTELDIHTRLLDRAASDRNLVTMAEFFQKRPTQLRPQFKNHKCVVLAKRQLAAGAIGM